MRTLRDWLDHLAARNRLAVIKPQADLRFEVAAYAKRLDGQRATLFPRPSGHAMPVVSGLISDRGWMAEAMEQSSRARCWRGFRMQALNTVPWVETKDAPAEGGGLHRQDSSCKDLVGAERTTSSDDDCISAGLMMA